MADNKVSEPSEGIARGDRVDRATADLSISAKKTEKKSIFQPTAGHVRELEQIPNFAILPGARSKE